MATYTFKLSDMIYQPDRRRCTLLLIFIISFSANAQWIQLGTLTGEPINFFYVIKQIQFSSEKTGYVLVGNDLFKTVDKGATWVKLGAPLLNQKTPAFDFVTDDVGFAIVGGDLGTSAESDMIYKTTDGGTSWSRVDADNILSNGDYFCINFVNGQVGFVSGGGLFKTTNGGANWTPVPAAFGFGQIQFLNDNIGFARNTGNYNNRIYKTVDGGNTWNVTIELQENITSFHFVDQSNGYFVGDGGLMYKTTDGGLHWQKLTMPFAYFVDVKFFSNQFGYILDSYGKVSLTTDGGASWTTDFTGPVTLLEVHGSDVYAAGSYGSIFQYAINDITHVSLQALSLQNITDSTATVLSHVQSTSNLVSIPLVGEIRKQNETYGKSFFNRGAKRRP